MWGCSEHSRRPRLRCTISQTPGAYFREVVRVFFTADAFRTPPVYRRGPWSKLRSGWRLEERPLTTFPSLRTARHPSLSLAMRSLPTPRSNPNHTFVPPTVINLSTDWKVTPKTLDQIPYTNYNTGLKTQVINNKTRRTNKMSLQQIMEHTVPPRNGMLAYTLILRDLYVCCHSRGGGVLVLAFRKLDTLDTMGSSLQVTVSGVYRKREGTPSRRGDGTYV